ncbi:MAG: hypothetical protein KDK66_06945, partial [Deltaproteobacteria bacterium]|nr:hypothetical protein [Deltaproteobacteria bacterium]
MRNRPKHKKRPDEFISLMDRLVRYFLENRNFFIGLLVLFFVFLGAYAFYQYRQASLVQEWSERLESALDKSGDEALKTWEELLAESPPSQLASLIAFKEASLYAQKSQWKEASEAFMKAASETSVPYLK